MKRTLTIGSLVLAAVLSTVSVTQAGDGKSIRVNIPFAFQVGKQLLAPGRYVVEVERAAPGMSLGSRLILRSTDGKTNVLIPAVPGNSPATMRSAAGLSFRKYNSTYFLAKVNTSDFGCDLIRSKDEKRVSAQMRQPEHAAVRAE